MGRLYPQIPIFIRVLNKTILRFIESKQTNLNGKWEKGGTRHQTPRLGKSNELLRERETEGQPKLVIFCDRLLSVLLLLTYIQGDRGKTTMVDNRHRETHWRDKTFDETGKS